MANLSPMHSQEPNDQDDTDFSTSSSAGDSEAEFVVDKILAQSVPENSDDGEEEMYLVKWDGYSVEQCTWEPKESFRSRETLEQWEREKLQGKILTQDEVDDIVKKMDEYAEAEEERRKRRQMQKEERANKGKTMSAVLSKTNKNLSLSSRLEVHGPQDSTGSRLVESYGDTSNVKLYPSGHLNGLVSPREINPRTKNFEAIGVEPKARRSSHLPLSKGPKGIPGVHFKTLRTQYRHQKAGRDEPAPDLGQIKLMSVTDIVAAAGEDIAHNLPSGDWRPASTPNQDLRSALPIVNYVDRVEAVQASSTNVVQKPTTPVSRQQDVDFANALHITGISTKSISSAFNIQHRDVHRLPNGRFWLPGEVLLHLALHEQLVGAVRVGGLPSWFKTKLILLKVEHKILIDFCLVEFWQYDTLCRGRSNDLVANAYIAPFEDSQAGVAELAESLDYNNRAALWYHPDVPYVLVAYAATSNNWRFLDGGYTFPPESKIHMALRNSMPRLETLATLQPSEWQAISMGSRQVTTGSQTQLASPASLMEVVNLDTFDASAPQMAEKDVAVNLTPVKSRTRALSSSHVLSSSSGSPTQACLSELPTSAVLSAVSRVDDVPRSETFPQQCPNNLWLGGSGAKSEYECSRSPSESEKCYTVPLDFRLPNGEHIDKVFQTQFGISYDYLTQPSVMPASRKEILDPGRARFYLAFPISCRTEMEALRTFLSNHTLPNLICTSAEPQGWDGFKTILGDKSDHIGVIIFHAKYTSYLGLPGLARLLKMVNVNLFSLSLQQVLPYYDLPIHVVRLFPNGTAILLTETSMTQQPERTLAILRWFSHTVKTKRGTWKLVLVPNVRHWLRQKAMQAGPLQACFLNMLTEVSELSLGQPVTYRSLADEESEAESLEGYDDEIGKASLVVSPANIPAYDRCHKQGNFSTELEGDRISIQRDKVLIEWFAGWAAMNAQKHRKFAAISEVAALFGEKSDQWGHIEVLDPNKYMLQNKIPFQRPSPTDLPIQSLG